MASTNTFKNHPSFEVLRIGEFRNLLAGRFLFIMGLRMLGTVTGWWIYELTNDPFAIGLIGLAEVIPAVSLALYAGYVIDISEKRKLLIKRDWILFSLCLDLAPVKYPILVSSTGTELDCFLHLRSHFLYGYYPCFYRPALWYHACSHRSERTIAKCHYLEPGHLVICICKWTCYCRIFNCRHREYRCTQHYHQFCGHWFSFFIPVKSQTCPQ